MLFTNWKKHFEINLAHFDFLNWSKTDRLNPEEKRRISSSLKQFQRGENSEGKHLIHFAKQFGDISYLETIKLFIKEEQRHAMVLGEFMKQNNIDRIKGHWVDGVFRWLRSLASLENSVIVLITAEIIAAVYYQALAKSTRSETLKAICGQILKDEEMHINFQSFTLQQFYLRRNLLSRFWIRLYHAVLMAGTTLVVWGGHRKVLKSGGFTLFVFSKNVFGEFLRSDKMIRGVEIAEILHREIDPDRMAQA